MTMPGARHAALRFACALVVMVLVAGCATTIEAPPPEERSPEDPWEGYNRSMHEFNNRVDRAVLQPAARTYVKVTPDPAQRGISNFFSNLRMPVVALNQLLQGKPREAGETAGRFMLNSTWGAGGLADPASGGDMPRHEEDFGQTLAVWGWEDSRYFVLPLIGPSTVRDSVGRGADSLVDAPTRLALEGGGLAASYSLLVLNVIQTRAAFLPQEAAREELYDDYAFFRDSYLQRRQFQISDGEAELPDYDSFLDDEDWDDDWD